jgi:threonine/homoserine/homoserine lactone efflux protein
MGAAMLWRSFRAPATAPGDGGLDVPLPTGGRWRDFGMGLSTNLMNPKVGVFYVAAIPQFVPDGVNPLLMGLLLALVHCLLGMAWLSLVVLGAGWVGPRLRRSSAVRWVDRVTGGVLVLFGARLAVSARV